MVQPNESSTAKPPRFRSAMARAAALLARPRLSARARLSAATQQQLADPMLVAVIDALANPALVLDRKGIIVHLNPAAAEALPRVAAGAPFSHAFRQPPLVGAFNRARQSGTVQSVEIQQPAPSMIWYAVSISPFNPPGMEGDEARRFLVSLTNLTEQRRTEAMRVDFVANASHELRTPLTSVIGFIDTLLGPAAEDPEARKKFLTIMRAQAERMSNLIEDLMSLSRIELRQHVRPTGSTDLNTLLREVAEGLQTQIKDAGLTLDLSLAEGDTRVTGAHDELYEVFENLMDNAIKYGAGGDHIALSLSETGDRPGYAFRIIVEDFGAGIDEAHVPRLTERFYRVDAESSRKKKGTGLGLAIVKHIVNRHRGQIVIRSRLGEGTRVDVLLPR